MLLTFEGLDGSGKTTQIDRLAARLEAAGRVVVRVREPGGTRLSEAIRALLLDPAHPVVPRAELLLFSAARAQVCEELIRPALDSGAVVLCDRFYDSTTAYQGGGRGFAYDLRQFERLHRFVTGGLVPDRTYLLRIDPVSAAQRRAGRAGDRIEDAGLGFFNKVGQAYDELARAFPARILTLDGRLPPDRIAALIWADLAPRLGPGTAA